MSHQLRSQRQATFAVLLACTLFLAAWVSCPYGSKIPLSDIARAEVDPALLGQWIGYMDDTPSTWTVHRLNEHEIYIEGQNCDQEDREDTGKMRAHCSVVDGTRFLNIKMLDEKQDELLLAKYELIDNGKILRVCTISDEYVDQELKTQADLVDYVRKNMKEKGFFEPPIIYCKK